MTTRLEAVNAVSARNELLPGLNTSVIRLGITNWGYLEKSFDFSNPWEAKVSQINLAMLREVEKKNGVGLWLSPPDRIHETGKILIVVRDANTFVEYDTTGLFFNGKDFASFMTSLSLFYHDGYYFVPDMELLEGIIPMPTVWQSIKNDQAEMKFNRDVEEALGQKNLRAFYQQRDGVDINKACPAEGGESALHKFIHKLVSSDGKISNAEKTYFVKNCGRCGASIEKQIPAGYCCPHCGGVFEGCG